MSKEALFDKAHKRMKTDGLNDSTMDEILNGLPRLITMPSGKTLFEDDILALKNAELQAIEDERVAKIAAKEAERQRREDEKAAAEEAAKAKKRKKVFEEDVVEENK